MKSIPNDVAIEIAEDHAVGFKLLMMHLFVLVNRFNVWLTSPNTDQVEAIVYSHRKKVA